MNTANDETAMPGTEPTMPRIEPISAEESSEMPAQETVAEEIPAAEPVEEAAEEAPAAEAEETPAEEAEEAPAAEAEETAEEAAPTEAKKYRSAHNTAAAAALNIEGEEVDVRRKTAKVERKIKTTKIAYEKKKGLYGYGFISLWAIGTVWLFLVPMFQSLWYSLCNTEILSKAEAFTKGMTSAGIYTEWNNFKNYIDAFTVDQKFLPALSQSLLDIAPKTVIILIFSLFIAIILNQKFRGRTIARAIFFLPVLIATGPVIAIINGDMVSQGVSDAAQFSTLFKTDLVDELMTFIGIYNINEQFTETIKTITSDIFNLVWNAGIQILIFLAALQNVSVEAKEAASMEGATAWEFFWKITMPCISPMILACLVYTVIDAFVDTTNPVMELVLTHANQWAHGYSAALAWIYFVIIGAALAIICAIVNKFVYYEVD